MSYLYLRRIAKVRRILRRDQAPSGILLCSAAPARRSADGHHPYRPSSDLFYLSGITSPDFALLVRSDQSKPTLFAPPDDPLKRLWEGPSENPAAIARTLGGARVVRSKQLYPAILGELRGLSNVYLAPSQDPLSAMIADELLKMPPHRRGNLPSRIAAADTVLTPMRLIKERFEVMQIEAAGRLTARGISHALGSIRPGAMESEVAAAFEGVVRGQGGTPAFETIAAAGASAATLHHRASSRRLRAGEMLLLDCGAELNMYAADVTRVYPVSGAFSAPQRTLYQAVLDAQRAAIAAIKPGVAIQDVRAAALPSLVEGLRELKILKQSTRRILSNELYRQYFPHGIGHSLGIDVHDVGSLRDGSGRLAAGMILTVEPGLYFSKGTRTLAACGVRIEDDVLVTSSGPRVLTKHIPKEIEEVEELFGDMR